MRDRFKPPIMRVPGRVEAVEDEVLGAELTQASNTLAGTLYVDDTSAFQEDGGQGKLISESGATEEVFTYTAANDTALTITGVSTLTNTYAVDCRVRPHPRVSRRYAHVRLDDLDGEVVMARVRHGLKSHLPTGIRKPDERESVVLKREDLRWVVIDVAGQDSTLTVPATPATPTLTIHASEESRSRTFVAKARVAENPDDVWAYMFVLRRCTSAGVDVNDAQGDPIDRKAVVLAKDLDANTYVHTVINDVDGEHYYKLRVRAVHLTLGKSEWSAFTSAVKGTRTVTDPGGLTASQTKDGILVSWTYDFGSNGHFINDVDYFEVQVTQNGWTSIWRQEMFLRATQWVIPSQDLEKDHDVRVRAVDVNGNASEWIYLTAQPAIEAWSTVANITSRQERASFAMCDDIVYVMQGHDHSVATQYHYAYDTKLDAWTTKADVPHNIDNFAAAGCHNGYIYHVLANPGYMYTDRYDPATNTWATGFATKPTQRGYMHRNMPNIDGSLFIYGGSTYGTGFATNSLEGYDVVTDSWTTYNSGYFNLRSQPVTFDGTRLYTTYVSGDNVYSPSQVKNFMVYWIKATNTWSEYSSLSPANSGVQGIASMNGKVWVHYETSIEFVSWNPLGDVWTQLSGDSPHKMDFPCVIGANGSVYVLGGSNATNHLATNKYSILNLGTPIRPGTIGAGSYDPVRAATAAALAAHSYSSTTKEITASSNGALTVDGVSVTTDDRVLVKDEGNSQNGLYRVVQPGSGSTPFKLRRAGDMDATADIKTANVVGISEGTTNADTLWMLTTNAPITLDTTTMTFARKDSVPTTFVGITKWGSD